MNRPLIVALILAFSPLAAFAQVSEDPAAKAARVEKFQERRLIIESTKPEKGVDGASPPPPPIVLRQGPDRIYHVDFVQLMDDPSLTAYWNRERNRDWAIWLGSGVLGVPLGTAVFLNNFKGEGALAPVGQAGVAQSASAGDLRSYALSVVGAGIALYGAYSLGLWAAEALDLYHPDRLDAASIEPRVRGWNDTLQERLNLDPGDIPSPPTPRPSPSPSRTLSPEEEEEQLLLPSPMIGGPDSNPYGGPPSAVPTPLPLAEPGVLPSELVPTPEPRPSVFRFYPGDQGYPIPSMRPAMSPTPPPAASPSAAPAR